VSLERTTCAAVEIVRPIPGTVKLAARERGRSGAVLAGTLRRNGNLEEPALLYVVLHPPLRIHPMVKDLRFVGSGAQSIMLTESASLL
jgi:hypothetical protein